VPEIEGSKKYPTGSTGLPGSFSLSGWERENLSRSAAAYRHVMRNAPQALGLQLSRPGKAEKNPVDPVNPVGQVFAFRFCYQP
jgi:hypothetical protein